MKLALQLAHCWATVAEFQGVLNWCLFWLKHQAWCAAAARILEEAPVPREFVRAVCFAVIELVMRAGREWTPSQKARVLGSFVDRAELLAPIDQALARAALQLLPIQNPHVDTLMQAWLQP
jgi:hypothetical protein